MGGQAEDCEQKRREKATTLLQEPWTVTHLDQLTTLFAWLISHQTAVLFSRNKPATSNQPTILYSQNKPAPAVSHQPNEHLLANTCLPPRQATQLAFLVRRGMHPGRAWGPRHRPDTENCLDTHYSQSYGY
jgi:hypothetical protein